MARLSKELREQRLAEHAAALDAARGPVAVMELFAQGREARGRPGEPPLEVAFAATDVDEAKSLPAAVWVALRQGEIDASIAALVRASRLEIVVGDHEELDAGYRLQTIEERRTLPDVGLLQNQLAMFLQIPRDVISMICEWGPEDSRTQKEIDALLDGRFGTRGGRPGAGPDAPANPVHGLEMSAAELTAMLQLTAPQRALLQTLVRQADVTIRSVRREKSQAE